MARIFGTIGTLGPDQDFKEILSCMANSLSHQDSIAKENVSFGWLGTDQNNPHSRDGILIVMDGHIYNSKELGAEASDATLFHNLYRKHGFEKSLHLINGDFAIACYDAKTKTLWLGRDRFGVRPLYYSHQHGIFAFASRPLPLLSLRQIKRDLNQQFVGRFAGTHYRYIDNAPHESPYQEIKQLTAAHILEFKDDNIRIFQYWKLEDRPDLTSSEETLAEEYRSLFLDAVKLRFNKAKKPGFTLSGGMDSSSVLAASRLLSGKKQLAVSTVYTDKTYDESDEIKSMLEENVEKWAAINVEPGDIFSTIQKMIEIHDEPIATATWLSHYILCQKAPGLGFQSLFGGLGGDELNAGEYEYFTYFFADLIQSGHKEQLFGEIQKWVEYHDHPIFKKNPAVAEENIRKLIDLKNPGQTLVERQRLLRYSKALNQNYFNLEKYQPHLEHPFKSYLKNRTFQDIYLETAPCCLRAEDRQTEAFGLDNFLPFFDHRLVEFMFRIPSHMKIRNGITKYLLREAMKGVLPEETRTRIKKTGWNAPAHKWFSGKGLDQLRDLVGSKKFQERGVYNIDEVQRLIKEHQEIIEQNKLMDNHMMFFWQLTNVELWMERVESLGR